MPTHVLAQDAVEVTQPERVSSLDALIQAIQAGSDDEDRATSRRVELANTALRELGVRRSLIFDGEGDRWSATESHWTAVRIALEDHRKSDVPLTGAALVRVLARELVESDGSAVTEPPDRPRIGGAQLRDGIVEISKNPQDLPFTDDKVHGLVYVESDDANPSKTVERWFVGIGDIPSLPVTMGTTSSLAFDSLATTTPRANMGSGIRGVLLDADYAQVLQLGQAMPQFGFISDGTTHLCVDARTYHMEYTSRPGLSIPIHVKAPACGLPSAVDPTETTVDIGGWKLSHLKALVPDPNSPGSMKAVLVGVVLQGVASWPVDSDDPPTQHAALFEAWIGHAPFRGPLDGEFVTAVTSVSVPGVPDWEWLEQQYNGLFANQTAPRTYMSVFAWYGDPVAWNVTTGPDQQERPSASFPIDDLGSHPWPRK